MFSLQRNLSFGYLKQRKTRTLLVVLSIALGVAALVATRALNGTLEEATRQAANPLAGFADLLVLNAQTGVSGGIVERLRQAAIPGVQDAQPLVIGRVFLPHAGPQGRSVLLIGMPILMTGLASSNGPPADNPLGVTVVPDLALQDFWDILKGLSWALVGEALDEDLRRSSSGSKHFEVLAASRSHELIRAGTVRFALPRLAEAGNCILLDVAAASRLAYPGRPGTVSQINLRLAPGLRDDPTAVETVRRRVQELVGDGADVRTPEANFEASRDVLAGLELGFTAGSAGALVVGLFLVYNVLAVSVAERRRDIGILRAVGATRNQVAGLFLGEAAGLGLVGSVLGLPLGWALARTAASPLQRLLSDVVAPSEPLPLHVAWPVLLACVAAGTLTAVLAALVPALGAAGEEPADAVRRSPAATSVLLLLVHLAAVDVLAGAGVAAVLGRESLPRRAGVYSGIVILLVAAMVAMPLLARLVGAVVQPLFRHLFGLEGWLAADNLTRSPGRTGIVIGAVAATGALLIGIAGFIRSTQVAVRGWIDQSIAADLFVTCGGSLHTASLTQPMDEKVGEQLRTLPGVDAVLGIHFHLLDFRDRIVFMLAVDADAFRDTPGRQVARNLARYPRLKEPNTVVISENFAALFNVHPGDHITIRGRHGLLQLEVLGTIVDYTWNRGTLMVDRAWYKKNFGDNQVDLWDLYLKPNTDPEEVRKVLHQRYGASQALFAATRAELHQDIEETLHRMYNLAYAQQFVVGLVALLGVASALFISVLQRRRQLGLLRAVGASRSQVLRSVLAEAALMGLIGGVLGLAVGVGIEWYILDVMVPDEAGLRSPLVVPWAAASVVFGLSALLSTAVGLWPAYVATRLRIPEAIAYE
jgi:putative ABC transport system permease protein